MRIRRPKAITSVQLMVVTAVGVIAGVYIWQPLILKHKTGLSEVKPNPSENSTPNFLTFLKNIKNTSVGLLGIGIISTFAVGGIYKFYLKPRWDREARIEAERYAEYLFEKELQKNRYK